MRRCHSLAQVGGPAGTMEGGRQADVAKAILSAKNIPYVVAAPLLIQVLLADWLSPWLASRPSPDPDSASAGACAWSQGKRMLEGNVRPAQ